MYCTVCINIDTKLINLDIRNKFFTVRAIIHGSNLPRTGRVPVTGEFEDVIGQGARKSYLGSLCHKRLD